MPRNWPLGLLHWGRFWLIFEPRDIWLGIYIAPKAVYVCVVPCLPVKWERHAARPGSETAATG